MSVLIDPGPSPARGSSGGFTLVELLVVVMVIAVLAGVLLVAILSAQSSARTFADKNLVRNIEVALGMFHRDTGSYPPSSSATPPVKTFTLYPPFSDRGDTPLTLTPRAFTGADWLGTCLVGTTPLPANPSAGTAAVPGAPYLANGRATGPYMPNDPKFVMTTCTAWATDPTIPSTQNGVIVPYTTATPNFIDANGMPILYFAANNNATAGVWPTYAGPAHLPSSPPSGYRFSGGDNNYAWSANPIAYGGATLGYTPMWNSSPYPPPYRGTGYLMSAPPFGTPTSPGTIATSPNAAALNTAQYLLIGAGPDGIFGQVSPPSYDDLVVWGP
jgi:prepilin-type N-terminal cleavage/methylation domain-containing protein